MTSVSKNVYAKKLDDIVNKYNNTYHSTMKVKKKLELVILLEYQNVKMFLKTFYTPNQSENVFVIKKVKNSVSRIYVINHLNSEEIAGALYEKQLQRTNHNEFRIEIVLKKGFQFIYQMEKIQ